MLKKPAESTGKQITHIQCFTISKNNVEIIRNQNDFKIVCWKIKIYAFENYQILCF
jgi:hypothetical protein